MSDGYRNGAFALGLVVGIGAALNLFLWSAYSANKSREYISTEPEHAQDNQDVMGSWDWFFNTFVDPQDTIAQWGMALLSLAAVYLLWETLKASRQTLVATRSMAIDTREIGEAQVRAYPHFRIMNITLEEIDTPQGNLLVNLELQFANSGQTPASELVIHYGIGPVRATDFRPLGEVLDLKHTEITSSFLPANAAFDDGSGSDLREIINIDRKSLKSGETKIGFFILLEYLDVFKKTQKTEPFFVMFDQPSADAGNFRLRHGRIKKTDEYK